MIIDFQKLNYENELDVNEIVNIPEEYLENTDIKKINKILVVGKISQDINEEYIVNLKIESEMLLQDAVTGEDILYPFTVNIEESFEKTVKTLDLIPFLWHYIILEVPLRITNSEGKYPEGENFRVISEEEYRKMNNPFNDFHLE